MQIVIIITALAVLALAVGMIVVELRRGRRTKGSGAAVSVAPAPVARPASVPPPLAANGEEDDIDVTRFGDRASLALSLPRLGVEMDPDSEEVSSDSTAMTVFEEGAEVDEPTGPVDLIFLSAAAQSDPGKRRKRNEDAFLLDDRRSLFVVADGMGGYAGGDIASHLATETIARFLSEEPGDVRVAGRSERPRAANELVASIEAANAAVYAESQKSDDLHGMGTTVVAASFTKRKRRGYIAYAGDSRCYRLRNRELKLLTVDHTFAAKGVGGPVGNQIRRAVGVRPTLKVDLVVDSPRAGDMYILCSDGLNKMISDEELRLLAAEHRDDLSACARHMVQRANEAGGRDNVTVVVVGVQETGDSLHTSSSRTHALTS